MKENCFVWANEPFIKNSAYIFVSDIESENEFEFASFVSAFNYYKLYLNGELVAFGPSRSAKGYFRRDKVVLRLKKGKNRISAVCFAYNVANYSYVKDIPFFYFSAVIENRTITAEDFSCYDFSDKIKNTQRYSFQRGFCEIYEQTNDLKYVLAQVENRYPQKDIVRIRAPKLLDDCFDGTLRTVAAYSPVEYGRVIIDETRPLFNDRSITQVGNCFEGYNRKELYECITDKVSRFVSVKQDEKEFLTDNEYAIFDFEKNKTGFLGFDLNVIEACELYVVFDEIYGEANVPVDFKRLSCANVVKWNLSAGDFSVQTAEFYTMRYTQVIVTKGKVKIHRATLTTYESSDIGKFKHKTCDSEIDCIIEAAVSTALQNSIDVLMDCPSRERSAWINDVYFSGKSSDFFIGNNQSLKMTLENYILCGKIKELPEGMIPMCYPAEHLNGEYIPNCAMWYAIILCEYLKENKFREYEKTIERQIDGLLSFFARYENEFGLLENLDSWVFVEWSVANSPDYVKGVNYPSNMIYYKMLKSIATYRADNALLSKAESIKKNITDFSFNGEFFEDNSVRENGKLIRTGHTSEACQYYAFDTGVASVREYPSLYQKLKIFFSNDRDVVKVYPNVGKANVIVGLLMRITLLLDQGEYNRVINEIKGVYGNMAKKTGTLWEHTASSASCNHGIAAYAGYILVRALTGFVGFENDRPVFSDDYAHTDGAFVIPHGNLSVEVTVRDGKRKIKIMGEKPDR